MRTILSRKTEVINVRESKEVKLERIIKGCIDRAEFDRKCYLDSGLYESGYNTDKKFNVEHTVKQIENLFNRGY